MAGDVAGIQFDRFLEHCDCFIDLTRAMKNPSKRDLSFGIVLVQRDRPFRSGARPLLGIFSIFDVFEGQLFAVFKTPAMADLLGVAENDPAVDWFGNVGFASFLIGGAFGGLLFGILADRIGRRQVGILILMVMDILD